LSRLIRRLCGLSIGQEKDYLVRHRLEPVIHSHGLDGFEHLLVRLQARGGAALQHAVVEAITTKETSFFRDRAFFEALEKRVLPECAEALQAAGGRRQRIRMWSAGTATGQEAYSLAMLVSDFVKDGGDPRLQESRFSILATDISTAALETGRAGHYRRSQVDRGLSAARLQRHFRQQGTHYVAGEPLRRLVQFKRQDLLSSPAHLGPFDLILCRNVLFYFDEPTRRRVCHDLHQVLQHGGWLGLGAAESLYGVCDLFESVRVGKTMLYRKPQQ
jgi:chemotaxis protein methyltransferase CheR